MGLGRGQNAKSTGKIVIETKTDNYTIESTDLGKMIILGSSVSADKTFTLPSVGISEDGKSILIMTKATKKLLIKPSDDDNIATGQNNQGLETTNPYSFCKLIYNHAAFVWELEKYEGAWKLEGVKFYINADYPYTSANDRTNPSLFAKDVTGDYFFEARFLPYNCNLIQSAEEIMNLPNFGSCLVLENNDWGGVDITPNIQVFNEKNAFCLSFFFMDQPSPPSRSYLFITHLSPTSNSFFLSFENYGKRIKIQYTLGSVQQFSSSTGDILTPGTTYHLLLATDEFGNIGVYVDGTQVLWQENTWNTTSIFDKFHFGNYNTNPQDSFLGAITDLFYMKYNYYNVSPNATLSDIITAPTAPFNGVFK